MRTIIYRIALLGCLLPLCSCTTVNKWYDQTRQTPQPPQATITDTAYAETSDQTSDQIDKRLNAITAKLVKDNCQIQAISATGHYALSDLTHYTSCATQRIDDLCYTYFSYLDNVADGSRFGRREFNTLADFTTTLLGITKTPVEQLAILSGARVAVSDTWNATEDMLLLSPAPYKLHKLVLAKQVSLYAAYQGAHRENNQSTTAATTADYEAAFNMVREYAGYCTRVGIHKILDEIVQEKIANTSADRSVNSKLSTALQNVAEALSKKAGAKNGVKPVSTLSVDDALALHSYLLSPTESGMKGYLNLRGLLANVDATNDSEKTALKQLLDTVIATSPDLAQKASESTPIATTASANIATTELLRGAIFVLQNGTVIKIGDQDISNLDSNKKVHYATSDKTGSWGPFTGEAFPGDLAKDIQNKIPPN